MIAQDLNPQGARAIATESFLRTQQALADITERRWMGAFYGPAGAGKTYAVDTGRQSCPIETCRFEAPARPTARLVALMLLRALLPASTYEPERAKLTSDLIELLSERPRLVVVDEAQNLTVDGVEFLRHLHDQPQTDFALALTGGNGCWEVLSRYPMLESRIRRVVEFTYMTTDDVLAVMPGYHPVYENADRALIVEVNDVCAHGQFRAWAAFTHDLLHACRLRGSTQLDETTMRDALAMQHGGRYAA